MAQDFRAGLGCLMVKLRDEPSAWLPPGAVAPVVPSLEIQCSGLSFPEVKLQSGVQGRMGRALPLS